MVAQTQDILLDCVLGLHIYLHISLATPSSHALLDEDSRLPESCWPGNHAMLLLWGIEVWATVIWPPRFRLDTFYGAPKCTEVVLYTRPILMYTCLVNTLAWYLWLNITRLVCSQSLYINIVTCSGKLKRAFGWVITGQLWMHNTTKTVRICWRKSNCQYCFVLLCWTHIHCQCWQQ